MKKTLLTFSFLYLLPNNAVSHEFLVYQETLLTDIYELGEVSYKSVPPYHHSDDHMIFLDEGTMTRLLYQAHAKDIVQSRIKMSNIQIDRTDSQTNQGGNGGGGNTNQANQNRILPFCDGIKTRVPNVPEARIVSSICGFEEIHDGESRAAVDDFHLGRYAAIEKCSQVEATLAEEYKEDDKNLLPLFYGPESFVIFDGETGFGEAAYDHHSNYDLSEGLQFECVYVIPTSSSS